MNNFNIIPWMFTIEVKFTYAEFLPIEKIRRHNRSRFGILFSVKRFKGGHGGSFFLNYIVQFYTAN